MLRIKEIKIGALVCALPLIIISHSGALGAAAIKPGVQIAAATSDAVDWYGNGAAAAMKKARALYGDKKYSDARSVLKPYLDNGHPHALYFLATDYLNGNGVEEDHKKSLKLFSKSSALGHDRATNMMSIFYENGLGGVTQDFSKVRELYALATSQGNPSTARLLAKAYEKGDGGPKDPAKAFQWAMKAKEMMESPAYGNNRPSMMAIPDQGKLWGGKNALSKVYALLAGYYENGVGTPKNNKMYFESQIRAAALGYTYSAYATAWEYMYGKIVKTNYHAAWGWAQLAISARYDSDGPTEIIDEIKGLGNSGNAREVSSVLAKALAKSVNVAEPGKDPGYPYFSYKAPEFR